MVFQLLPIAAPRKFSVVTWSRFRRQYFILTPTLQTWQSAIDAVRQARQRCWRYDWVLDFDVKGYFDSIDWELLLSAVCRHTNCPWVLLYVERWLKAPVQMEDGSVVPRTTDSSGWGRQPHLGESVSALCVRYVDGENLSSAGCAVSSNGCVTKPKARETGLHWQLCHGNGRTTGAV